MRNRTRQKQLIEDMLRMLIGGAATCAGLLLGLPVAGGLTLEELVNGAMELLEGCAS